LEHNPFGMWQSLVNRLTRQPSYLYNLLKRNAPVRSRDLAITIAALPLLPVAALAELIAGLCHRGGTIAVLAQRAEQRQGERTPGAGSAGRVPLRDGRQWFRWNVRRSR
ncbi:MAG: hypothetical protein M3Z13_00870, partial [Candidatus Dormibacteraeota bacterium]|nr:hypothetical protein [Candidatus Dormibacteraeota bacterium]